MRNLRVRVDSTAVGRSDEAASRSGPKGLSHRGDAPNNPDPPVQFVKINWSGQHQQSGGDEVFASFSGSGEPTAGDDSGDLGSEDVAAL